ITSRRRHTISDRDWSSDVCSSDLAEADKAAEKALAIKPESAPDHLEIARRLEDIPRLSKWAEAEYRQVLTIVMPGSQHDFTARRSEERRVGKEWWALGGR